MDLTSLMSALLSDNSISAVSDKTGASAGDVAGVMAAALPVLLNGANGQASNPETTESFHEAVTEHAEKDPEKVDIAEGEKIVGHLLGDDAETTEKAIAKKTGLSTSQVALILAAVAPLVMKMLGGQTTSSNSNSASSTASVLSSLLGGNSNSSASSALMTAALGAVLSGALSSGSSSSASSSNSMLGSLLGAATGSQSSSTGSAALLNSLLGATTQQSQSNSTASLLGSLLGGSSSSSNSQQSGLGSIMGLMNSLLK